MYASTTPSAATRPDFLVAVAIPRLRNMSIAFASSPTASVNADLHSIIPAPVFSLRALIAAGVTSFAIDSSASPSRIRRRAARCQYPGRARSRCIDELYRTLLLPLNSLRLRFPIQRPPVRIHAFRSPRLLLPLQQPELARRLEPPQ